VEGGFRVQGTAGPPPEVEELPQGGGKGGG
jgi:hypothetical protein